MEKEGKRTYACVGARTLLKQFVSDNKGEFEDRMGDK